MKNIEEEIQALASKVDASWNAGDAKSFASYWTEDGTIINPQGKLSSGRKQIEEDIAADLAGPMKDSKHKLNIDRIYTLDAKIVFVEGIAELSVKNTDGGYLVWKSQFVAVCTKQPGHTWHFVHMRAYVIPQA